MRESRSLPGSISKRRISATSPLRKAREPATAPISFFDNHRSLLLMNKRARAGQNSLFFIRYSVVCFRFGERESLGRRGDYVEELAQWLKRQHKGLRTYKTFQQKVLEIGSMDRRQYALYYLVAMLVDRFIDAYDEMPLTLDITDEAHKRLLAITEKAARFDMMAAEDQVELLNELAVAELSPVPAH
jgi:hypothetical protein